MVLSTVSLVLETTEVEGVSTAAGGDSRRAGQGGGRSSIRLLDSDSDTVGVGDTDNR